MAFSALLFDLDGTLVDSHHEICLAVDRALRDIGLDLSFERVRELVDGSPLEVIWATLHPESESRPEASAFARFAAAYRSHYMRDLGHATQVFPGVVDTLTSLRRHKPELLFSVVSNKHSASVDPLLEVMGLSEHFALTLGAGGTDLAPKPSPDLLLKAAERLGCAAQQCVMVGDTVLDVRAGKQAGMLTVALSYGMGDRAALTQAGADHVLDTFADLGRILLETKP